MPPSLSAWSDGSGGLPARAANWHESEDAFQATFLVLAGRRRRSGRREQLASWLYGVARHIVLDARARATRRSVAGETAGLRCYPLGPTRSDRQQTSCETILDEELARLPELKPDGH